MFEGTVIEWVIILFVIVLITIRACIYDEAED